MDIIEKYNKLAEEYAQSRVGTEDKIELKKFKSFLKQGDKILDVGCAAGRDTRILKDMGLDAVGSDLAEKLLEIAKRTNPDIEFVHADMRALPFDDGVFKGLWASAVLHHVTRDKMSDVLQEFWRILKPHGTLYIHTKAGQGLLQTNEATVKGEPREFELVTARELDKMLQDAHFKKIDIEEKPSKSRPGLSWVNAFYSRD